MVWVAVQLAANGPEISFGRSPATFKTGTVQKQLTSEPRLAVGALAFPQRLAPSFDSRGEAAPERAKKTIRGNVRTWYSLGIPVVLRVRCLHERKGTVWMGW